MNGGLSNIKSKQLKKSKKVLSRTVEVSPETSSVCDHQALGKINSSAYNPPQPPLPQSLLFQQTLDKFSYCITFSDLSIAVTDILPLLDLYPFDNFVQQNFIDVCGSVDSVAMNILLEPWRHLFPFCVDRDGNCMPRSLSVCVFGSQESHIEIRACIVIEMVLNSDRYLDLSSDETIMLCALSDHPSIKNVRATFEREFLDVCKPEVYMGLWQLMAAANALSITIQSVYPALGATLFQNFMNRRITPEDQTSGGHFLGHRSGQIRHSQGRLPQPCGQALWSSPLNLVSDCSKRDVTLGGHGRGRLTAETIKKLQIYYSRAIFGDKTAAEMKTTIYVSLFHGYSTDNMPLPLMKIFMLLFQESQGENNYPTGHNKTVHKPLEYKLLHKHLETKGSLRMTSQEMRAEGYAKPQSFHHSAWSG
ncbi:vertnin [Plakobranchus ocellatus]|uniref:Vertnin n=1 Tax=Plakobranchus ocellatus TaxID=259542 RepID=A0AAV3ZL86_9GAST|nr:vertnin [Plakobranchus ocellatus]